MTQARAGQAMAQCPAHDDGAPSLSLRQVEGQALLHCFAGCQIDDILTAINWGKSDLFDQPQTMYTYPDRTVIRSYTSNGKKNFRQSVQRPGEQTQLYHLDRINGVEKVFLVEGEKDVHALESVGVTATTAPMGAVNFNKCDVTPLYGKTVIAVVDNDLPGAKWAEQVHAALGENADLHFCQAAVGKDAADHIAAGLEVAGFKRYGESIAEASALPNRRVKLTKASDIKIKPVLWAWAIEGAGRVPAGSLTITAGREGTGKSSFGIWLAAQITQGTLPGSYYGTPRKVFYLAVEDSWTYTIAPRLAAAGADLDLVYRFEVVSDEDEELMLSLPTDNRILEADMVAHDVALVVIDPLMSVLGEKIDTHRTREVRFALDPLAKMADRTGSVILGIAHFNKGSGTDASTLLSGSHAFRDVPRSIFGFARDDSDGSRVMTQVKNSLGRDDLPSFGYLIETAVVITSEGPAETSRFVFTGESERSVADLLRDSHGDEDDRSERDEAAEFIRGYLAQNGGSSPASDVLKAGRSSGFTDQVVKKARKRSGATTERHGFGPGASWVWSIDSAIGAIDTKDQAPEPMAPMAESMGRGKTTCMVCGVGLDAVLAAAGDTTHPTCEAA